MATVPFSQQPPTRAAVLMGERVLVYFIPHGTNPDTGTAFCGADATGFNPKGIGLLCTLESMDAIPIAAETSETIRSLGKSSFRMTTTPKIDEFNLMFDSGDIYSMLVMQGKDTGSATANVFIPRVDNGPSGDLFIQVWSESDLRRSVYIPDLSTKFSEVVGGGASGDRLIQNVTFYKDSDAKIYIAQGTKSFAVEYWKEISAGVPGAAPDGATVDFVLGTSNYAGINGTTSPVALLLDNEYVGTSATNLDKYFIKVVVDGTLQANSQVSYTTGTRTLTFGAALASGKGLLAVYCCNYATALPPNWTNGTDATYVEAMKSGWPVYGSI